MTRSKISYHLAWQVCLARAQTDANAKRPLDVVAQIPGYKPSLVAEKHHRRRPLDLLRKWHDQIEAWVLDQAGMASPEAQAGTGRHGPAASQTLMLSIRSNTMPMYTIKPLPEFDVWFDGLKDPATRARLIRRLEKAARGLLGDVEATQSRDIMRAKELARALRDHEEDQS